MIGISLSIVNIPMCFGSFSSIPSNAVTGDDLEPVTQDDATYVTEDT